MRWDVLPGAFRLAVGVPANTTATVHVPAADGEVSEGGGPAAAAEGLESRGREGEAAVFRVGSGEYLFESRYAAPG